MKNEREKEAGKERKTVVERARGQRRADDKATPPQQHGKRELTGEPAAATQMKIWLMMKMMIYYKTETQYQKEDTTKAIPLRA